MAVLMFEYILQMQCSWDMCWFWGLCSTAMGRVSFHVLLLANESSLHRLVLVPYIDPCIGDLFARGSFSEST